MSLESDSRYIAIILDQPAMGTEWKSWLTVEFSMRGLHLQADGSLEEDGLILGFFRFLDKEGAEKLVHEANIEIEALQCPWAGPIRGALEWVRAQFEEDLLRTFLPLLVRLGGGPLLRMKDSACHQPIRRMTFSLDNLLDKRGFEDGEALLSRSPDYLDYVLAAVNAQLRRSGLDAAISESDTVHNPLRLRGTVRKGGAVVSELVLYELSVDIWAYDWQCIRDVSFW